MFRNLEPNSEYVVSVSMRNAVGEGPAAQILVSTPPEPNGNHFYFFFINLLYDLFFNSCFFFSYQSFCADSCYSLPAHCNLNARQYDGRTITSLQYIAFH